MRGLIYLILTRFKNQLKSIVRSPAKLVYTVLALAFTVFILVMGSKGNTHGEETRDITELCAGLFALLVFVFIVTVKSGFSTGASLFKMPDVALVFTAQIGRASCRERV